VPRGGPVLIQIPGIVTQVAAGSNHTVMMTSEGEVYTVGSFQKGQLGRTPADIEDVDGACSSSFTNGQSSRSNDGTDGLWCVFIIFFLLVQIFKVKF
jgi:Regulator of chromosome condensation (RCC1) repeat